MFTLRLKLLTALNIYYYIIYYHTSFYPYPLRFVLCTLYFTIFILSLWYITEGEGDVFPLLCEGFGFGNSCIIKNHDAFILSLCHYVSNSKTLARN